jgi:nucleoside-specific outer membrane channel protein Tsx
MRNIDMKQFHKQIIKGLVVASMLMLGFQASAYKFSTSKVEVLAGDYDERSGKEQIFTFANATGFSKGDSFFFMDVGNVGDADETGGIHAEFNARLSVPRTFGVGKSAGILKDYYIVGQADYDGNRFTQKTTPMAGFGVDWKIPGFKFFKTNVLYRDDPTKDGSSTQVQLIWNKGFNLGSQKFSFEGFMDITSSEGNGVGSESNILTQPQLVWHATKNLGVGIEYQYWQDRLGIKDLDEKTPQLLVRWTF